MEAGVLGVREIAGVDARGQARRRHHRLQRPRLGVLGGNDPDLRARLRRGIPARRRRLGPAPGAGGRGPSGARLAHRAVGDPRRVRSHHLQQDGSRSRHDRADEPAVRQGRQGFALALPGHSARGQRGDVSAADRPSLLHAGQGDPQGGPVLSRGSQGGDLRHRRPVASDQRPARRADQQQMGQELPRQSVEGPEEARADSAYRLHARGRRRRHRDGHVAGHARRPRRQGRRGLPLLHRAGLEHRRRAHHPRQPPARGEGRRRGTNPRPAATKPQPANTSAPPRG